MPKRSKRKKWAGETYRMSELVSWNDELEQYDMSSESFIAEGLQTVLRQIGMETRVHSKNMIITILDLWTERYMVTAGKARYIIRRLH